MKQHEATLLKEDDPGSAWVLKWLFIQQFIQMIPITWDGYWSISGRLQQKFIWTHWFLWIDKPFILTFRRKVQQKIRIRGAGCSTSAKASLKEMRWPSFSVSTSTPSQSNSSAAGRETAGAAPSPTAAAAAVRTTAAVRPLPARKQSEEGADLLATPLGMRCWPEEVLGTRCAFVKLLPCCSADDAAAAMERGGFRWAGNGGGSVDQRGLVAVAGCRCG